MKRDDGHVTRAAGRAGACEHGRHVGAAAEIAIALGSAAVEPQASVSSAAHDHQLVATGARGVRRLPVAELAHRTAPHPRLRRRRLGPVAGRRRPLRPQGLTAR